MKKITYLQLISLIEAKFANNLSLYKQFLIASVIVLTCCAKLLLFSSIDFNKHVIAAVFLFFGCIVAFSCTITFISVLVAKELKKFKLLDKAKRLFSMGYGEDMDIESILGHFHFESLFEKDKKYSNP